MAKECKGLIDQPDLPYKGNMRQLQAPQAPEDRHCDNYDNDAHGWVRGVGKPHPNFDSSHKAKR